MMSEDVFSVDCCRVVTDCVSGANIDELMAGVAAERERVIHTPYEENESLRYAAARNILFRKGKVVEILANYEPSLQYISEWWKQLYGESEGKDKKGLMPASVNLTTDLHSLGQFYSGWIKNYA